MRYAFLDKISRECLSAKRAFQWKSNTTRAICGPSSRRKFQANSPVLMRQILSNISPLLANFKVPPVLPASFSLSQCSSLHEVSFVIFCMEIRMALYLVCPEGILSRQLPSLVQKSSSKEPDYFVKDINVLAIYLFLEDDAPKSK